MALLDHASLTHALLRLGELASCDGKNVELLVVGGAVMVLEFKARLATRDVDAVILNGLDRNDWTRYTKQIASENGWPDDWLNDAAKGFVTGQVSTTPLLTGQGIRVYRPSVVQLLAMKLCAWRDDVDIEDAARLLKELPGNKQEIWSGVEPHVIPGQELKARYAFDDLWEARS